MCVCNSIATMCVCISIATMCVCVSIATTHDGDGQAIHDGADTKAAGWHQGVTIRIAHRQRATGNSRQEVRGTQSSDEDETHESKVKMGF